MPFSESFGEDEYTQLVDDSFLAYIPTIFIKILLDIGLLSLGLLILHYFGTFLTTLEAEKTNFLNKHCAQCFFKCPVSDLSSNVFLKHPVSNLSPHSWRKLPWHDTTNIWAPHLIWCDTSNCPDLRRQQNFRGIFSCSWTCSKLSDRVATHVIWKYETHEDRNDLILICFCRVAGKSSLFLIKPLQIHEYPTHTRVAWWKFAVQK